MAGDQHDWETEVLGWNRVAMDHLRLDHFEAALGILRNAEESLTQWPDFPKKKKLLSITLNNLGCFYKRTKRPTIALHYLRRALEIESKPPPDNESAAGTHLNICSIRSGLGAHEKALEHAKKAIRLLTAVEDPSPNSDSTLVVAYHNAGIQYEFLQRLSEAAESYTQGYAIASQCLGVNHPLTQSLRMNCEQCGEAPSDTREPRRLSRPTTRSFSSEKRPSVYSQPLPRIPTASRKRKRADPPVALAAVDLDASQDVLIGGGIRYITGDRLRPMHKKGYLIKYSKRAKSKDSVHPMPPSTRPGSKSYRTRLFEVRHNLPSSEAEPLDADAHVSTISQRLQQLQSALHGFEETTKAAIAAVAQCAYSDSIRNEAAATIQMAVRVWLKSRKRHSPRTSSMSTSASQTKRIPAAPQIARPQPTFQRKSAKADHTEVDGKMLTLQCVLRRRIAQDCVLQRLASVVAIQTHMRRYLCSKRYKRIRTAIVCIQRSFRQWSKRH